MTTIRFVATLLATATLLLSFTSCAVGDETGDTLAETNAATQVETETEELKDDLPDDLDYGGDEVVIYSRYREGWTSGEIAAEEIISEPVNDAVYERNRFVENRLKVKIVNVEENEHDPTIFMNKVATLVNANTHEYDIVAGACYVTVHESLNGTFADLRRLEYIDFEKPWWSQGFNEVVEYQGAQYAVTGSMLLSMYRFAFVTVFNKDMFDNHKVAYLYDDVRNGTWTLDRQIELVSVFHEDAVNQGTQDEKGDIYGLVTNDYISVDPYWSSCMVDILQKNEDGDYELVFSSSKLQGVAEKVLKLYYETGDAVYDYKHEGLDDEQVYIREMFAEDGAAMATLRLMETESAVMRDMTAKYGIVPMPKYENAQDGYRTLLHDQFTVLSIPTTIDSDRLDEMGAVLEALGSISYTTVRPAYYETTLRTKIAQDVESAQMLDIVVDNIYIDAGIIYTNALSSFHDQFRQIIGSKNNTVTSSYKGIERNAERALGRMIKKLNNIGASS